LEKYHPQIKHQPGLLKGHLKFLGELMIGHLRYGTQGKNKVEYCHPFINRDTIPARNLALAGNFNIVNADDLYTAIGKEPLESVRFSDLAAMIELMHTKLCEVDERSPEKMDISEVLKQTLPMLDGGFFVGGATGSGIGFLFRDAHGIRPAYYYIDDEVIVGASERSAIRTCFNVGENEVQELMPGQALIVDAEGKIDRLQILEPKTRLACSFERIYFSRGSDEKIYQERLALGYNLSEQVLDSIDHDLKNTKFSFIPNTAEVAFYGLLKGMEDYLNRVKVERILSWGKDFDEEKLREMITRKIRIEKIAIKDVKMRTFITEDASRNEMVQHVYDVTYGVVRENQDTLVIMDDSIVRGTTLKQSILRILDRLHPKKIIVVSSAPQIRYPDCYGIDMAKLGDFIAFQAAIALHKERQTLHILDEVYAACLVQDELPKEEMKNEVRRIYEPFSEFEIAQKIAELVTPNNMKAEVEVIYQNLNDLHTACPNHTGDWYFSGNYPTPGGNKVVNKAFMNYYMNVNERAY
jgi:amidophosphoribosyltransferase